MIWALSKKHNNIAVKLQQCRHRVKHFLLEPFQKDEIRHLLDGRERVGNAAGPEAVPEGVDFGFEVRVGEHGRVFAFSVLKLR